ncbi:MAG: YIP1 family protein [Myxococcota bacterium]|nr:YIP1 family protein [Myxococcota bacterium]
MRWLAAPLKPFFVAVFPDRHVRPEVIAGRYGLPLLSVILCACLAAFALGTRLDVGPAVRADDAGQAASAESSKPAELKTDREIDEEIGKRVAVARVKLGLGAALVTPLRILGLALALLLLARFIGGKPTMPRAMTVAALAAVPSAVRSLITAVVAWRQPSVFPDELDGLVSFPQVIPDGHPVLARLLTGIDVFTWWSVVILAFGLCAAADLKPRKSIVAIAIGFVLYLVVTNLIMGGPPPGAGR